MFIAIVNMVLLGGFTDCAIAAGETVIVLLCVVVPLPHGSVNVHVSV